jgi:hypothetical protein
MCKCENDTKLICTFTHLHTCIFYACTFTHFLIYFLWKERVELSANRLPAFRSSRNRDSLQSGLFIKVAAF